MILDATYSEVGRSTGQQLDALRRQLGVGIDPAYDYSHMVALQKSLLKKKKSSDSAVKSNGDAPLSPSKGPTSAIDDLKRALRDVVGGGASAAAAAADEAAQDEAAAGMGGPAIPHSPGGMRALQDQSRPSPAFVSTSRNDISKLDVENRFRAPPIGTYRPKADLCLPRTKGSVEFGSREPTRSRKTLEVERQIEQLQAQKQSVDHLLKPCTSTELLESVPERPRARLVCVCDLNKGGPRPDPVQSAGIVYNVNSFTAGVLDGDLKCSNFLRNPVYDFAKLATAEPKPRESYFQPGQYRVKLEAVRPGLVCKTAFEKQPARKPLRETVGRVEIKERAGAHLPDRSLSRSCPLLEPRLLVPDFKKYSERPPIR